MMRILLPAALGVLAQMVNAEPGTWHSEVLLNTEAGMGGVAIGDLDPESAGNEVAVVNGAGEIWLVARNEQGWRPRQLRAGDGELIMCAIGDVDPRYDGNEFVGVGMVRGEESTNGQGQVLLIREDAGDWVAEAIFKDDHMLHGVAVGDVSARHDGNEIVACGFNHRVTLLHLGENGWSPETIYVANNRLKIALAADVLPERAGLEALVCGSDGNVVALWENKLGWRHRLVFSDPVGQSRIATGELGILVGGDKGKVTLCRRQGDQWSHEFLARDTAKIRGVVIADVDPEHPGEELYACGYSRKVFQLVRDDSGYWESKVLYTAERPLHHLAAGEFDPTHPGPELVTCGHGGRLIALYPRSN